ncbi:hypothetical protein AAVH_06403 [Aphelenchoides avenae]|nr:hypothetical protein AAVH_06403 [Aphelenchus avenae]
MRLLRIACPLMLRRYSSCHRLRPVNTIGPRHLLRVRWLSSRTPSTSATFADNATPPRRGQEWKQQTEDEESLVQLVQPPSAACEPVVSKPGIKASEIMIPAEYGRVLMPHREHWQPILEKLTNAQIDVEALRAGTCHMRFRGPMEGVDHLQRIFAGHRILRHVPRLRARVIFGSRRQPAIAVCPHVDLDVNEKKFQSFKNVLLVVDKDTTLNAWTVAGFSEQPESVAWLAAVLDNKPSVYTITVGFKRWIAYQERLTQIANKTGAFIDLDEERPGVWKLLLLGFPEEIEEAKRLMHTETVDVPVTREVGKWLIGKNAASEVRTVEIRRKTGAQVRLIQRSDGTNVVRVLGLSDEVVEAKRMIAACDRVEKTTVKKPVGCWLLEKDRQFTLGRKHNVHIWVDASRDADEWNIAVSGPHERVEEVLQRLKTAVDSKLTLNSTCGKSGSDAVFVNRN